MILAKWPLLLVAAVDRNDNAVGGANGTAQDTIDPESPPGAPARAVPSPMRPVADMVAPRWRDEDDRDDVGELARVVQLAKIGRGQRVADIGAGGSDYVTRLSPLVGTTGQVYGQDSIPDYLAMRQRRVLREGLRNVRVVRGDTHDPRLPAASVDVATMIHMCHEIEQPFALLGNRASAMRPGGRLAIRDLERPTFGHGTPASLLRGELVAVGYRQLSFTNTAPSEYVAIFASPDATARPTPASISTAFGASPCRAPGEG